MPYKFIDGVTVADIAFEASGRTIEEMFESAANALMNTQIDKLDTIAAKKSVRIKLKNVGLDRLLHDFLQELIFYKDAKLLIFSKYDIKVEEKKGEWFLAGSMSGEKLDLKKHTALVDVKAVSWHLFKVEKKRVKGKDEWTAFVIIDV